MRLANSFGISIAWLSTLAFAQPPSSLHVTMLHGRPAVYEVHGRYAIVEGDIIIGTAAEIQGSERALRPESVAANSVISGAAKWPNATIPYEIDPNLNNPQRVLDAVQHWNINTPLRLVERNGETNYVLFSPGSFDAACESFVGMHGGEQDILITDACTAGNLIHEIGHAFGLQHEHTRNDRNAFLTVLYQNVDKRYRFDFDQARLSSTDLGYFDYDSIMEYGPTGFSRNNLDTIETVPPGIPIGQRAALSPGDIDGVSRLYGIVPTSTTVSTAPPGLQIIVDGVPATSPQSYSWAPGSMHTVSVPAQQGTAPRYVFARWSDGGDAAHSITASPGTTVFSAAFVRQYLAVAGVISGSGSAAITPASSDGYYPDRMQVLVSETPDSGAQFLRWQGFTNFQSNGFGLSSASAVLDLTLPAALYLAQFTSQPVTTIDSYPHGRVVTVDGTVYLTPVRFAWSAGSTHVFSTAVVQSSGNNTVRYNFTGWNDAPEASRAVVAGSETATYTASFATQYLLTTLVSGSGRVTISRPSPDGFYDAGTTVELTAVPATGSILRYWIGDPSSGSATQPVTMTEDRLAVAVFGTPLAFRVLNSASNVANPVFDNTGSQVAPGELVSLYGLNIGPANTATASIANNAISTTLAGTRVLFDGQPAPILYAGPNQINVITPALVGSKSSTTAIQIQASNTAISSSTVSATDTAPALFTADGSGTGQIAALNQDGIVNGPQSPARPGSVIVLFGTGAGALTPPVADGQIAGDDLSTPVAPVYVRIGKLPGNVRYAGSAPGLVNGVLQVNVQLPDELISGSAVPIELIVGSYASPPGTTIAVQ